MSHKATIKLLDKLGENYDSDVHKWRKTLEKTLLEQTEQIQVPSQVSVLHQLESDEDTSQSESSLQSAHTLDDQSGLDNMDISIDSTQLFDFSPITCQEGSSPCNSIASPEISILTTDRCSTGPADSLSESHTTSSWHGFTLVGDNLDMNVERRHIRIDRQKHSLHYFQAYAVRDRVDLSSISDNPPNYTQIRVDDVVQKLKPTEAETESLINDCVVLMARTMCEYVLFFKDNFSDAVEKHIPHEHIKEMSMKSEIVSKPVMLVILPQLSFGLSGLHNVLIINQQCHCTVYLYIRIHAC